MQVTDRPMKVTRESSPHHQRSATHTPRMPGESVAKQLLFTEGLVGLVGTVGAHHSMWRDRASAALPEGSHVLVDGVGLVWGGSGPCTMVCPLWQREFPVGAPSLLPDPLCLAPLNMGMPFVGSLPVTLSLNGARRVQFTRVKGSPGAPRLVSTWRFPPVLRAS
eukprot:360617-Chlamydomonas_euryale.AAC.1